MLRHTSIFQLVVLPYLRQTAPSVGSASMRVEVGRSSTRRGEEDQRNGRRCFCSSSRRLARSRQKVAYSTLESTSTSWEPPVLDGIPWRVPPIPPTPPRRFRPPLLEEMISVSSQGPTLIRKSETKSDPTEHEDSTTSNRSDESIPLSSTPRPDVVSSRTVQEILDTVRRRQIDPEHRDLDPLPSSSRTAIMAMRKIVDVHRSETERSKRTATALGHKVTPRPNIPPLVNRLLKQKEYRLAVFHILQNPNLATSDQLLETVASRLDTAGQDGLAQHLRSVMKDTRRFSINYNISSPSLPPPDTDSPAVDITSDIPLPPDPEHKYAAHWTDRQKVTHYLNAQLVYLSYTPYQRYLTSKHPILPPIERHSQRFQNHGPGLHHLRDMLNVIDRYRRRWGFEPDRVTANIILKTWIRCTTARPARNPYRMVHTKNTRIAPGINIKEESKTARLGGKDLLAIFQSVSDAIQQSVEAIDLDVEKDPSEVDWEKHVWPFVRIFQKAFKEAEYTVGEREVMRWNDVIKKYLSLVTSYRALDRARVVRVQKAEKDAKWDEEHKCRMAESRREYDRVKEVLMRIQEEKRVGQGKWGLKDGEEDLERLLMKSEGQSPGEGGDGTT